MTTIEKHTDESGQPFLRVVAPASGTRKNGWPDLIEVDVYPEQLAKWRQIIEMMNAETPVLFHQASQFCATNPRYWDADVYSAGELSPWFNEEELGVAGFSIFSYGEIRVVAPFRHTSDEVWADLGFMDDLEAAMKGETK